MTGDAGAAGQSLKKSDYEHYPRTLARDDFWGQVRRTIHGVPVGEDQIQMIVEAIVTELELTSSDVVLDLACGNGALSSYLYDHCSALTGVDLSDFLISVAKENFEQPPRFAYLRDDVAHYVGEEKTPERFTKVLCYGSFSFFSANAAELTLTQLRRRFTNVERVFLGNLPDRALANLFYENGVPDDSILEDHTEQIGTWRSEEQMSELAGRCGWLARFVKMPDGFFARGYRYDVVLSPS